MSLLDKFEHEANKIVLEEIERYTHLVLNGPVGAFEEYWRARGRLEGLAKLTYVLDEARKATLKN